MTDVDLALVEECAALAPSVHNTQPWELTSTADGLEVRADRDRQLGFLDPEGRQLLISCGLATEFARLAVRSQGRSVSVDALPDASDRDLVARLRFGDAEPPTDQERRLVEAMPRRYTDRGPYADEAPPAELLKAISAAALATGTWLQVIDRHDARVTIAAILEEAEGAEAANPAYAEELRDWTAEPGGREGVPEAAGSGHWPQGVVSDVPLRDFTGAGRHPHPGADEPPRVERDTIVLLGTDHDDPAAWVATGRALASVLLTITAADLSAQPLGPATDFPAARSRVRQELGLLGYAQFLLRLGYGQQRPWTGRRGVAEAVEPAEPHQGG
jgi:nitroreductase